MKKNKRKPSLKRKMILFILYTFLFITLFFFLDYYNFYVINPYLLIVFSIILGGITTYIHLKSRRKSEIDRIVDKLD